MTVPRRREPVALVALGALSFAITLALRAPRERGVEPGFEATIAPFGAPIPSDDDVAREASPMLTTDAPAPHAPPAMPPAAPSAADVAALAPSPELQQAMTTALTADDGNERAAALDSLRGAPIALVLPVASQVLRLDPDVRNRLSAVQLVVTAADRESERDAVESWLSRVVGETDDALIAAQARASFDESYAGHPDAG